MTAKDRTMHRTRRPKTRRLRIVTLEDRLAPAQLAGPHGPGCGLCGFQPPPADPAEIQRIYTEGTTQDYMSKHPDALQPPGGASTRFQIGGKWSTTATNGPVTGREAVVLTWGFVADGLNIPAGVGEPAAASTLIAFLDGIYPGGSGPNLTLRPWFGHFQSAMNRLGAVSGVTYVYQAADDGASFPGSAGVAGVRPDVRLSGHPIDGPSNTLAYNYFPNSGDMVIDTNDGGIFGNTANSSRALRNVLMHEQGHGLGLNHEDPINGTTLMEAFLSTAFDGPQFDDVLGLQRNYGDQFEKGNGNETTGNATAIGNLAIGGTITRGASGNTASELTGATATDFVSIDDDGDTDVYSFTVAANALFTAVLTPVGPTYPSGPQGGATPNFVSSQQSDLTLQVLDSTGAVIATANAGGVGVAETLGNIFSGPDGGTFYVRAAGAANKAQMYQLQLTAAPAGATVSVVSGDLRAIGTSVNNTITVKLEGANYRVTDPVGAIAGAGAVQVNATTVDVPVASVTGIIDVRGNDGNDSLALDLSGGNVSPPGGLLYTGGNGTDTVVGPNVAAGWSLTSAGGGTLTAAGMTTLTFVSMEHLTGGSQADGFTFAGGNLTGTITGGGGSDTVTADGGGRTFAATAANGGTVTIVNVTPLVSIENLTGGSGADTFAFTGSGTIAGTVDGAGGNDALTTPDAGYTFTLTGTNLGSVTTLAAGFVSVETLVGGAGADTLVVQAAGTLTGPFGGGAGSDTVNLAALAGQALTVSALGATDGFDLGGISALTGGVTNINLVVGSGAADSLTGRNVASTWTVSGADAGTYVDDGSGRSLAFSAVESLAGGTAIDLIQFTGGSLSGTVNAGAGTDTVIGDNAARAYTITAANAGTVSTILPAGFSGVENLQGGTAADTFAFGTAGGLTGTIAGGPGADTLIGTDAGLTFSVTGADTGTVSTVLPAGFAAVENLQGGAGADTFAFAGGSLAGTVVAAAGSDTLIGDNAARTYSIAGANAGTVGTLLPAGFAGVENLQGGSAADTFAFGAAGSLTGTIAGGAGADTVTGNDAGLTFSVTAADAGTVSTVLPAGFTSVENLTGGAGADTFQFASPGSLSGTIGGGAGADTVAGDNTARTYTITGANAGMVGTLLPAGFTAVENLQGGSAADTFTFGASGSLTGTIHGGAGSDALVGTDAGLTFTVTAADAGTVSTVLPAGFASVENLSGGAGADTFTFTTGSLSGTAVGGAGADTLIGPDAGATVVLSGADAGSVTGVLAGFVGVETVLGGTGADTLVVQAAGALAGPFDGGAGADAVNLAALGAQALTVGALGASDGFTLIGVLAVAGGLLNVNAVVGPGSPNTLTGRDAASTWTVTGANAGTYVDVGSGRSLAFTAFESHKGGTAGDLFRFAGGSLTGSIAGGAGTDTVAGDDTARTFTVSGANSGTVSTILPAGFTAVENLQGGSAADTFTFGASGSLTGTIAGGGAADTLVGRDAGSKFTITGVDAGTVSTVLSAGFAAVENLQGRAGGDSFTFAGGSLTGSVGGGAGDDLLVGSSAGHTFTLTGAGAGSASGLTPAFTGVETIRGGTGADTLVVETTGSLAGPFDGRAGADTVDLSALAAQALTVAGLGAIDGYDLGGLAAVAGGLFNINAVIGTTAGDTLTGRDAPSTWTISGADAGTYAEDGSGQTVAFSGVESLVGATEADLFRFTGGSLTGTIAGGAGTDTLTGDDTARTFTITGANAGTVSTILPAGFAGVENLQGGSAADTFTFGAAGSLTGTVTGGGAADTLIGTDAGLTFAIIAADAGTVSAILPAGFVAVEHLTGGTGGDTFTFAGGSLTGTISGSSGTDSLVGDNTARTFTINAANAGTVSTLLPAGFAGVENLQGGTAADTFGFGAAGSLSGTIAGGGAADTLIGTDAGLTFTLTAADAGTVTAILPGGFVSVEHLAGGSGADAFQFTSAGSLTGTIAGGAGTDTLTGDNAARTFAVTGANAGTVSTLLSAGFAAVENLQGGSAADTFTFGAAGSLTGTVAGGGGADTLVGTNAGLTFTVTGADAGTVSTILASGFIAVENLTGGTGTDTFQFTSPGTLSGTIAGGAGADSVIGDNTARTFTVSGANAGTVSAILPAGFGGVENLQGGSAADTFAFESSGSLTGTVNGGAGGDTLAGTDAGLTFTVTAADAGTVTTVLPGGFAAVENLTAGTGADTFTFAGGTLTGAVAGGAGTDTVAGDNTARTFTLTGTGAGTIATLLPGGFIGVENLVGGTAADTFTFGASGSLIGTIGGGTGSDTLIGTDAGLTFTVTGADGGTVSTVLPAGFAAVENLQGGSAADTFAFAGGSLTGTVVAGAGTDTLIGDDAARTFTVTGANAGTVSTILPAGFAGVENLQGGSAADAFTFGASGGLTGTIAGGSGADTVSGNDAGLTFTVTGTDAGNVSTVLPTGFTSVGHLAGGAGADTFAFAGGSLTGTIAGGTGTDTLVGDNTARSFAITGTNAGAVAGILPAGFGGVENLQGGSAADTFTFGTAGLLAGTIHGSAGSDTLVGNDNGLTFTLTGADAGTVTPVLVNGFVSVENLAGGAGDDTFQLGDGSLSGTVDGGGGADIFVGDNTGRTYTITGVNSGTISGLLGGAFTNVAALHGGSGTDQFVFGPAGRLTGTVHGGGGADTLTGTDAGLTYTVTATDAGIVSTILPAGFAAVENLTGGTGGDTFAFGAAGGLSGTAAGGAGADTLIGPDAGATFTLSGAGIGAVTGVLAAFTGVETVLGGSGADTLVVQVAGSLAGPFGGGTGADTVNLAALGAQALAVGGLGGTDGFDLTGLAAVTGGLLNINAVVGSGTADSLTGRDAASTWTVMGADAGTYTDDGSGRALAFGAVESLVGGTAADLFRFAGGSLSGTIVGGAGTDTLRGDDAARTFTVTGGNAGTVGTVLPAGFAGVENLQGGSAEDTFTFGAVGSLAGSVNGGGGADTLTGTDAGLTFTVTGADAGTVSTVLPAGFASVENLTGGTGADSFAFTTGNLSGLIDGGAGADTLQGDDAARTYTVTGANAGTVATVLPTGFVRVEELRGGTAADVFSFSAGASLTGAVHGGAGADTLVGTDAGLTYTITGVGAGTVSTILAAGFTAVEHLIGGAGADTFRFIGGSLAGAIAGGAGTDTFIADDAVRTFTVTGANAGTVGTLLPAGFTGVENLQGGSAADTFTFGAAGSLTGTISGGGGADTLVGTDAGLTYTVTGADAGTVSTVLPAGFTAIENLTGGTGADTFVFTTGNLSGLIDGGAGTDTLQGDDAARTFTVTGANAGTVSGILPAGFTAIENLRGGSAADAFSFGAAGSLAGSVNGGGGADTLIGTDAGLTYTVTGADAGTVSTVLPAGFAAVENLTGGTGADTFAFTTGNLSGTAAGGSGADTLIAPDAGATFTLTGAGAGSVAAVLAAFTGVETVVGGSGADTLVVQASGALAGSFDGRAGADTVDLSALGAQALTLAGAGAIDGFDVGGLAAVAGGLLNINAVVWTAAADTLTGRDVASTWIISGANAGTYTDDVSGRTLAFSGVESLVGGSAADLFRFAGGSLTGTIAGGAGTDTLRGDDAARTYTVNAANAGSIGTLLPAGFTGVENLQGGSAADTFAFGAAGTLTGTITGGAGADTLVGTDAGLTFTVTGADAGTVSTVLPAGFASVENLTGGTGADSFAFISPGNLSGLIDGGAGTDSLLGDDAARTYTVTGANAGTVATVLPTGFVRVEELRGGTAADAFTFGASGSLVGTIDGGAGTDTLVGTDAALTYTVTGADAGTVSTILAAGFAAVERLTAGAGADTFRFTGGSLSGAVAGGAGTDTLIGDDSPRTVTVTGANAGTVGTLLPAGFTGVENLQGGSAADAFTFGAAGSLTGTVAGGGGADTLVGTDAGLTFTVTGADAGTVSTVLPAGFASVENLTAGAGADTFAFAGGSLTGAIDGGAGADTLRGDDAARTFTVTGANAGTVGTLLPGGFIGVENLRGGAAADTFTFGASGTLAGTIDGGAGGDTLVGTGAGLTFTVTGADAGTVSTVLTGGFASVENLTAGAGADTFAFAGGSLSGTAAGGAGADTLVGTDAGHTFTLTAAGAGSASGLTPAFTGVETVRGGSGADTLVVQAAGTLAGPFDGGAGSDTVNLAAPGAQALTVGALGATDGFTLVGVPAVAGGLLNVNAVVGSGATDSLTGRDALSTWTIATADAGTYVDDASGRSLAFSAVETLFGGTAADLFRFTGGSLTGTIGGGAGADTVAGDNTARTYTLTGANAGTISTALAAGFSGVENLQGGSAADAFTFAAAGSLTGTIGGGAGSDTLFGTDAGLTYTVTGPDAGTVSTILPAGFAAVENLTGGSGADTFAFAGGSLSGVVSGGAGTDTLVGDDAGRAFSVTGANAGTIGTLLPGGFAGVESLQGGTGGDVFQFGPTGSLTGAVHGGAGGDLVIGSAAGLTYTVTGSGAGSVSGILPAFAAVESLRGGSGADTLVVQAGGSLAGSFDGAGGADAADLSAQPSQALTVTGLGATDGFDVAGATAVTGGFLNIESLVGTANADRLIGRDAASTWTVSAPNAGTYSDDGTGRALAFAGFESLTGGSVGDRFQFTTGSLAGDVAGGAGADELAGDNGGRTFAVSGPDAGTVGGLVGGGFAGVENLRGGAGADTFAFGAAGSLSGTVAGGAGADSLVGTDAGLTYTVTGPDAGTVSTILSAGFTAVENLVAGAAADTVRFTGGSLTGTVAGGAGADQLVGDDVARTYTVTGANAGTVSGLLSAGFTGVESLTAGSAADAFAIAAGGSLTGPLNAGAGTDTLTGTDAGLSYSVTGANAGAVSTILPAGFAGVENLTGGSGADTFAFTSPGSLSGQIDGGAGADRLVGDDAARTFTVTGADAGNVSTLLAAFVRVEELRGGASADTFAFGAAGRLTGTVSGGSGSDTLVGTDAGLTFAIAAADAGTVSTILPAGFAGVENLTAGTGADTFRFTSPGALTGAIVGGAGADTLIGDDGARTFKMIGANAGTVSALLPAGFTGVENLQGGSAADTFTFGAAGSLGGTIHGGSGPDTLVGTDAGQTFTVTGPDAGTVTSVLANGFASIEHLTGGAGADTFRFAGGSLSGSVVGGAGADTLTGDDVARSFTVTGADAGTVGTLVPAGFTGVENLGGGSAGDTFAFAAGGSLTGTVGGGGGADTLIGDDSGRTFAVTGANAGTVSGILPVGFATVEHLTGGAGADAFQFGGTGSLSGSVAGGAGDDVLTGADGGHTFTLSGPGAGSAAGLTPAFSAIENLVGGSGLDALAVGAGGMLAGSFDGRAGTDTVNLSALGAQAVVVTGLGATDGFNLSGAPAVVSGFHNVDALVGSGAADTLTGRAAAAAWTVGAANAGTYADDGSGRSLAFSSVENLAGGSAADLFRFAGGTLTGTIAGGAGVDTLVGGDVGRTYTIAGPDAGAVGTILPAGFTAIENLGGGAGPDQFLFHGGSLAGTVTGGAGSDLLSADTADRTFNLTGADAGTVGGLAGFAGVENLRGGAGADTLVALPGGSTTGGFDGGDGLDTADLTARAEALQVNLQSAGRTGYTLQLGTVGPALGVDRVTAGGGTADLLTGLATAATWQVRAGADQTFYRQTSTGYLLRFTGFDQLIGGAAADAFGVDFSNGVPVGSSGLLLDAAGGTDVLTVTGTAGADAVSVVGPVVAVNGRVVRMGGFERLTVNAADGNDHLTVGLGLPTGLALVELFGGAGNDFAQVAPSPTARIKFDGGVGTDRMRVDVSQSGLPVYVPPPGVMTGTYLFASRQPIDFVSVELREFGPLQ